MDIMNFGQLLEKLLFLSNQKKVSLAKYVGYDTSYISKWVNSKSVPTSKNANSICRAIAEFITNTIDEIAQIEITSYFEINIAEVENPKVFLTSYIEQALKDAYMESLGKPYSNYATETYSQEISTCMCYIKPKLKKNNLIYKVISNIDSEEDLSIVVSVDLFNLKSIEDKILLMDIKKGNIYFDDYNKKFKDLSKIKFRFLSLFDHAKEKDNIQFLLSSIIIFNMICEYTKANFEIYNCDIVDNMGILAIKNKLLSYTIYQRNGTSLLTNVSKDKSTVDEFYDTIDASIKSNGNIICKNKSDEEIILDSIYMEYIMGYDLRVIFNEFNEVFMPEELFLEVAKKVYGDKPNILKQLKKIWIFMQSIVYKSDFKVLISDYAIRKYISSGEITFFNNPVKLTFKQRAAHIENIEKIIKESESMDVRIIDGKIVNEIDDDIGYNLFLSRSLNFIKVNPRNNIHEYAVVTDDNFKCMCNRFFNVLWNERLDIVCSDKIYILKRMSKYLKYLNIINDSIE